MVGLQRSVKTLRAPAPSSATEDKRPPSIQPVTRPSSLGPSNLLPAPILSNYGFSLALQLRPISVRPHGLLPRPSVPPYRRMVRPYMLIDWPWSDYITSVSCPPCPLIACAQFQSSLLRNSAKMASKAFGKRFGFKRRNTDREPVTVAELSQLDAAADQGDASSAIDVRDISETEANHRLNAFRQDHKWDPNMPEETIDMVDAVTEAHDHKGEAQVVGEVIENSPYPEVYAFYTKPCLSLTLPGPRCGSKLR